MPLQNRVTPGGDLVAVAARGTLTGNRGVLHDDAGRIVRQSQVARWITCELEFRGRHREVMAPRRWTHLFFLDEATALAAGHRPCAECRRADYQRFGRLWQTVAGLPAAPSAGDLDRVLQAERSRDGGRRRTSPQPAADLPDGAIVQRQGEPWLVLGSAGALLRWTPAGYRDRRALPGGVLDVLTPPATLAVLRAGYLPRLHPTVG